MRLTSEAAFVGEPYLDCPALKKESGTRALLLILRVQALISIEYPAVSIAIARLKQHLRIDLELEK
jgi:hypothetical protein